LYTVTSPVRAIVTATIYHVQDGLSVGSEQRTIDLRDMDLTGVGMQLGDTLMRSLNAEVVVRQYELGFCTLDVQGEPFSDRAGLSIVFHHVRASLMRNRPRGLMIMRWVRA